MKHCDVSWSMYTEIERNIMSRPYKVIRIQESGKFLLVESGILSLEFRIQLKESGVQCLESRFQGYIQLEVYYQCCVLIGWATTGLYIIAH